MATSVIALLYLMVCFNVCSVFVKLLIIAEPVYFFVYFVETFGGKNNVCINMVSYKMFTFCCFVSMFATTFYL